MTDFTKLTGDIVALSGKVDGLLTANAAKDATIADLTAKLAAATAPVDEQPAVDAADAAVEAITAKIP